MNVRSLLSGLGIALALLVSSSVYADAPAARKTKSAAYRARTKFKGSQMAADGRQMKVKSCKRYRFATHADFIYWSADIENGMIVARNGLQTGGTLDISVTPGKGYEMSSWKPGFKFGVGLSFPQVKWDLDLNYTFLASTASRTVTSANNDLINGWTSYAELFGASDIWAFALFGGGDLIKGKWKHFLNVFDFELGRRFMVGKQRKVSFRPHFGLKGTWQHETMRTFIHIPHAGNTDTVAHENFKQSLWGIGPRGGLNGIWYFVRSFGIYGDLALAALYASFSDTRQDSSFDAAHLEVNNIDIRESTFGVLPVFEIDIGLCWETCFSNCSRLSFKAGWEAQVWFGENHYIFYQEDIGEANLTFQGLTARARYDF